jgi:transcriptional antiterminator RfaH
MIMDEDFIEQVIEHLENPFWYCIRTQPKNEHIATAHLRKIDGIKVFCPRIRYQRATIRGKEWCTEAMFTGYIFAKFDVLTHYHMIRFCRGVNTIVKFGEEYGKISDSVVTEIQECLDEEDLKVFPVELMEQEEVQVTEGPLLGLGGVVKQLLPAKERVKILLDFMGRRLEVEAQADSVVPRFSHPLSL